MSHTDPFLISKQSVNSSRETGKKIKEGTESTQRLSVSRERNLKRKRRNERGVTRRRTV